MVGKKHREDLQKLPNMRTCAYLVSHQMMEQGLIESSGRGATERHRLV